VTRHFLTVSDLEPDELATVLDLAEAPLVPVTPATNGAHSATGLHGVLAGRGVALVFEHPSARTRNACELAVVQLGGHPVAIRGDEVGIDTRESAEDVARTLGCYHALIAARVERHATLDRMASALEAEGVAVPVVNLLSDREHPTQAIADVLTIRQHFGDLTGRTLAYVGDGNNVCRSLVGAAVAMGLAVRVASPPGYGLTDSFSPLALRSGANVEIGSSPEDAVAGADVVYTDVWVSMGQVEEVWVRRRAFSGYTVDETLMAKAAPHAIVLHCLPAHRGEEISAGVLSGDRSLVWQQAANRMHATRGLFAFLLEKTLAGGRHESEGLEVHS
jgi:ornithine carbamoyltransferase